MPKTIAQELEDATARIATFEADCKAKDDLIAKLTADLTAATEAQDKLTADLTAATEGVRAATEAHTVALKAETDAHAATKLALDEATKKLADPAYQIAGAKGSDKPAPEGGQAKVEEVMTREQAEAAYSRMDGSTIEGARARAEFRMKHKDILGL